MTNFIKHSFLIEIKKLYWICSYDMNDNYWCVLLNLYNLLCLWCTQVTSTMNDNYWCVLVSSYITYLDVLKWHLPWIFSSFFFIIKCQECNKNRQNVFSTTNYFAIVQRINVFFLARLLLSPLSVRPLTFHILINSSEATWPIWTKLWWNGPWMAPFQKCVWWSRLPTKMATKLKIEKRGDEILIVHCCFSISQSELKF